MENKKDNKSFFRDFSQSLDDILDIPAEQWTQKEINLYNLLNTTMEKYKLRYTLSQFKFDVRDIKNNVKKMNWYADSKYKKTIDWCLDQLVIKSFQRSKKTGEFRVTCKFTQIQAICIIHHKGEEYDIQLKSPILENTIDMEIKNMPQVAKVFGINDSIPLKHKKGATMDIYKVIHEIAIFYN